MEHRGTSIDVVAGLLLSAALSLAGCSSKGDDAPAGSGGSGSAKRLSVSGTLAGEALELEATEGGVEQSPDRGPAVHPQHGAVRVWSSGEDIWFQAWQQTGADVFNGVLRLQQQPHVFRWLCVADVEVDFAQRTWRSDRVLELGCGEASGSLAIEGAGTLSGRILDEEGSWSESLELGLKDECVLGLANDETGIHSEIIGDNRAASRQQAQACEFDYSSWVLLDGDGGVACGGPGSIQSTWVSELDPFVVAQIPELAPLQSCEGGTPLEASLNGTF